MIGEGRGGEPGPPLRHAEGVAAGDAGRADFDSIHERRLRRLREELRDERVPLSFDGPAGLSLLTELAHARRPRRHEGRIPRYGALVFAGVPDWDESSQVPLLVPGEGVAPEVLRRYADGRSSFAVVTPEGITGLVGFEHSMADEVSAVRLQRTGAVVVQRTPEGAVRVCAGAGVVLWTGSRWRFKPLAEDYVRVVARLAPHADRAVLGGLLELAVHSLAAERVGATFIWNLDGAPPDDPRGGLLELARAIQGPPLSVARRGHFPALQSIESQIDLATVVAGDGSIGPIAVRLDHTSRAGKLVPPMGGARHTSARRFTFDVPGVLAVVVSESGRVTVCSGGAVAAEIHNDERSHSGSVGAAAGAPDSRLSVEPCPSCQQPLLVQAGAGSAEGEGDTRPPCPVCGSPLRTDPPVSAVLGVPVRP